ncbi:MAG TPA: NusG domain II-containing protein [Spirochaetia bacterium]|nr:NusG domain II-containing protein [Spirochaetia bacterium]
MRRLRILDYFAIIIALMAIGAFSVFAYSGRSGTPMVDIQGASGHWIYPIDVNRTVEVAGPLGETMISIHDSRVLFVESPCPDKLCIRAPALTKIGEWNACLPNRVFARIEGKHDQKIDAVSF